jgi:membrane-bound ClpP family serine protease
LALSQPALANVTTPGNLASKATTGGTATDDANAGSGKTPFAANNVPLGFPADISEKPISHPLQHSADSIGKVLGDKANSGKARIYEFESGSDAGNSAGWHHTNAALEQAMNLDVDMVYIHLNTFSDFNVTASDIRNKLNGFHKPMTVFIDNGQNSTGTIISLQRDSAGPLSKANQVKTSVCKLSSNQFREKYKTCVTAIMSKPGQTENGRDTHTAVKSTESNVSHTARMTGLSPNAANNLQVFKYQASRFERILDFLLLPWVSMLLIVLMTGGILLELKYPGSGFPLLGSVAASILLFIPLSYDGLAQGWEILVFALGSVILLIQQLAFKSQKRIGSASLLIALIGLILSLSPALPNSVLDLEVWLPLAKSTGLVLCPVLLTWAALNGLNKKPFVSSTQEARTSSPLSRIYS